MATLQSHHFEWTEGPLLNAKGQSKPVMVMGKHPQALLLYKELGRSLSGWMLSLEI